MMTIKTIRLIHLLSYLLITSQVLFYLVVFSDALKLVSVENFLEQRRVVEPLIASRFKLFYYIALALSLLMVVLSYKKPDSALFISSALALFFLVVDLTLALTVSVPLNTLINNSLQETGTGQWEVIQTKWLDFIRYRGIFTTAGMISLLVGLVKTS